MDCFTIVVRLDRKTGRVHVNGLDDAVSPAQAALVLEQAADSLRAHALAQLRAGHAASTPPTAEAP